MKIEINETDFDVAGRPVGALRVCVAAWASRMTGRETAVEHEIAVDFAAPLPDTDPRTPLRTSPGRYAEERRDATQGQAPPAETAPAETAPAETAPAETAPAETAPAETVSPKPTESKPKTKKRRTRAEIDAADDAACQIEIATAVREGREPDKKNLPADTRRRVGQNPKSWIDPGRYAQIARRGPAKPDPSPEHVANTDTADASVSDFSAFIDDESKTAHDETTQRFEIGNKLVQLGQLSRPAAVKIVEGWKQEYNTTAVPDIPAEHLGAELARVEAALDAETPE